MNAAQDAVPYAQALLASVTIGVLLPAAMMLTLLGFAFTMILLAQRRPDFDITEMFKGEDGRVSVLKFTTLMSFAVHSAYFYASLFQKPDPQLFIWYGLIWAGTPPAVMLAQKWDGQLPFARGGAAP